MGSTLGVGVGVDETTVAMDVLSESGPASVKLLADVVEHPLLPESELARLKTNMLRQIAVAKTQPGQIALARFRKLMYGDHPYGDVLPTEETVNKLTIADAQEILCGELWRGARAFVCGGKVRCRGGEEGDRGEFRVGRKARRRWRTAGFAEDAADSGRNRPAGSAAVDALCGVAGGRTDQSGHIALDCHQFAARRVVCFADYERIFASRKVIRIRREARFRPVITMRIGWRLRT